MGKSADKSGMAARFLGLGAFTVAAAALSRMGLRAMEAAEMAPIVDALREPPPGGGAWPRVSVIVPARNEERNLPRLLPSLLGQSYPDYEVIVVDDQSQDASPSILRGWAKRDPRLKVVWGKELPRREGWMGKPFAMHQGAQAAIGDWLLFTDADTVHRPNALGSAVAFAMSHGVDLFSILPRNELITPAERLIMPVSFEGIMALYPPHRVNDPRDRAALANGQFLLIRREVYRAVGGAESVKGQIAEDMEFAKKVKGAGYRLYMADGRHLMNVRMYTSLSEIWEGWSKNVLISLRNNPGMVPFTLLGLVMVPGLPFFSAGWVRHAWKLGKAKGGPGGWLYAAWVTALATWNVGLYFFIRRRVDKMLGLPLGWTFTQPLGGAVFALIMLYSFVRLATGKGVVWKGRTYHGE